MLCMRRLLLIPLLLGLIVSASAARSDTILNFQDVLLSQGSDVPFFVPIHSSGFKLTATSPASGFSSGFEVHGPSSTFFAGEVGVFAFAPATLPDNVIELTQDGGGEFSLVSVDLARNFAFDPAPTVTFTGTKAGGGTVTEAFTVTVPVGQAAFQRFDFSGFDDLISVSWGQPPLSDGLDQFANIDLNVPAATVPEPGFWLSSATWSAFFLGYCARRRKRNSSSSTTRPTKLA